MLTRLYLMVIWLYEFIHQDMQWAAKGVLVRNPAFDVTPADLVTGLITEKGVVLNPSKEKIDLLFISD